MERYLYKQLLHWKESNKRKPLVLEGPRQVGKTWLLKHFGEKEYENLVYINCDSNPILENVLFDYDIPRIIRTLSALSNTQIKPNKTLIFFDEVQEFPKALTSLKYFCENALEYHVVAAGSLLGLTDHEGSGFPVGKIDTLYLYPLSFMEFLLALGKKILVEAIRQHRWEELNSINPTLTELLRQYYYVGGMPEVVLSYVENQDLNIVRNKQKQILHDYKKDISKHAPKRELPKITMVFDSISSQLAKENKKFIYSAVKKGGRAKEFENAIEWLINAGIVYKVYRVKKLELPLKHFIDIDCFKLYINDLGLLGAMADSPAKEVLIGNNGFSVYKGSFTEQYIAQQYYSSVLEANITPSLYYYTNDNSTLEIDFVIQKDKVFPIEVKAEENLKSKSLSTVLKDNSNLKGIRFSMSNYREQSQMVNVPLVFAEEYLRELPRS
ncbi:MAG: ATP-binding protein [Spirochaetales bacterium]|nr:ATP-binding protein [Spirochaetales bacterium]